MTLKAIIFDFDGIITDTEPVHMEAWLSALEPLGISFDDDEFHDNYIGMNDRDMLDVLGRIHQRHFTDTEKADLIEAKLLASMNMLEHKIPLIPGVSEVVPELSEKYLLSICSGAMRSEIEFILRHLKWSDFFKPLVTSDSVKRGKPDPEGYIRAVEGLVERSEELLLPENVIAIEDSPKGIRAAKSAGLTCIAISTTHGIEQLKGADRIYSSLMDVTFDDIC
jgi:beta-phosphoglucomutase